MDKIEKGIRRAACAWATNELLASRASSTIGNRGVKRWAIQSSDQPSRRTAHWKEQKTYATETWQQGPRKGAVVPWPLLSTSEMFHSACSRSLWSHWSRNCPAWCRGEASEIAVPVTTIPHQPGLPLPHSGAIHFYFTSVFEQIKIRS